ncbi:hypothetical protein HPB50_025418 [Hyalomma asiaticum]|uniref:Uncharacterized protein n=1 Tax=Hyalomma asiaticum TaxID=266040 RepID=A0ACB7SIL5_HYAAI|nr:hypothetical protein HPB50_025418 [Hyalomma asiaticum]
MYSKKNTVICIVSFFALCNAANVIGYCAGHSQYNSRGKQRFFYFFAAETYVNFATDVMMLTYIRYPIPVNLYDIPYNRDIPTHHYYLFLASAFQYTFILIFKLVNVILILNSLSNTSQLTFLYVIYQYYVELKTPKAAVEGCARGRDNSSSSAQHVDEELPEQHGCESACSTERLVLESAHCDYTVVVRRSLPDK